MGICQETRTCRIVVRKLEITIMRNKVTVAALLLVLLLFAALPAAAQQKQKFHIESFGENSFDMSAREKPTSRDDGTGKLY